MVVFLAGFRKVMANLFYMVPVVHSAASILQRYGYTGYMLGFRRGSNQTVVGLKYGPGGVLFTDDLRSNQTVVGLK